MTGPVIVTNPFYVPRCVVGQPLRPWKTTEHANYYVPVDDTQTAFELFQEELGPLGGLETDGRLVVVIGESGTGKSALIHRCAHWLTTELRDRWGHAGAVVDLTRATSVGLEPEQRDQDCFEVLVEELSGRGALVDGVEFAAGDSPNYAKLYLKLGNLLDLQTFPIVILPKVEDTAELVAYAKRVRPRMVFLAEFDKDPEENDGLQYQIDSAGYLPAVHLAVHALKNDDGITFVRNRMAGADSLPAVDEDGLKRFVTDDGKISIRLLQALMRWIYDHLAQLDLGAATVTYDDLTKAYFKMVRERRGDHDLW